MRRLLVFFSLIIIGNVTSAQHNFNFIRIDLSRDGGPVYAGLIVEDEFGRRTGRIPLSKTTFREIPNAQYGDEGGLGNLTKIFSMEQALEGIYTIKVIGFKTGSYRLFIRTVRGTTRENRNGKSLYFGGDTRYGKISEYKLYYETDQTKDISAEYIPSFTELSVFATRSIWLKQNSEILSGSVGVNEAGEGPFLDSQVELSFGIGTQMAPGYCLKANRVKVKQNGICESDVYYNELTGIGTVTGTQYTPLHLPLYEALPEFHTGEPGTQDILLNQNEEFILDPGDYGDIQVKLEGKLIFTGGIYNIRNLKSGDNTQLVFRAPSEIRISEKFEAGQKSFIGPEDSTAMNGSDIVFYVGGINGNTGKLGATPKAAKVGLNNTVFANFYVPNGTLWLRQNSEAEGSFIGKDVVVGINVKVSLKSAW